MKYFYHTFITLLALVLTACNGDIFLDGNDLPEAQDITVEGDGGEATITIPTKNLEHFGLDVMSSGMPYCHYYNAQGKEVDYKAPATEVRRIVFENLFTKLELIRNGSRLTIRSICSTNDQNSHWTIRLEYSYGVRFINLEVLPGLPIQLVEVKYNDDMVTWERAMVTSFREGLTNDGPLPQKVTTYPYLNELASVLVGTESQYSWLQGERFTMPVPVYENGEWVFREKSNIRPGTKYTYEGPDRFTKVDVDVPPYSKVNIFTDVVYAGARVSGTMVFHNEVLDVTFTEPIYVTSFYPTGHEIRIEDAK